MGTLMPNQTVQFCNADYRVLHQISWRHAVKLILKGFVYVIDTHQPAVHVRSASLVNELPVSIALREYVYSPYTSRNRVTRAGVPGSQRVQGRPDPARGRNDPYA
ncbi:hypothetical protein HNP40_000140 [Mycobacteroides chelonae]|nr:hypothetical protein [Mycobacteroides chelonae]